MTSPNPFDTIREALNETFDYLGPDRNDPDGEKWGPNPAALAALTEVEHQLADAQQQVRELEADPSRPTVIYAGDELEACEEKLEAAEQRANDAEAALAEANAQTLIRDQAKHKANRQVDAANARANDLADALRNIRARVRTRSTGIHMDGTTQYAQPLLGEIDSIARAALDRQEQR